MDLSVNKTLIDKTIATDKTVMKGSSKGQGLHDEELPPHIENRIYSHVGQTQGRILHGLNNPTY